MHELALAQGIVGIVEEYAAKESFGRVNRVHVEIGALSHVLPEALELGFEAASAGTRADGAKLEIHRSPGRAWCVDCSENVEVASRLDPCPSCGGDKLVVTAGDEMRVLELEVD
jgi:hydrogenase nickel incorporation protein HypA/HybF